MAVLTLGLANLRRQVDARWLFRDRRSDGWIGDAAHMASNSSHNADDTPGSRPAWDGDADGVSEVRAWDMDSDLGEPGTTAQMIVDHVRSLSGVSAVIRYMIYNRKIYHSRVGFAPEPYVGSSPHTEHIHFEGAWSQAGDTNATFDFHLEEVGQMPLTDADADKVIDRMAARLRAADPTDRFVLGMRAAPWQYPVGGSSILGLTTDTAATIKALAVQLDALGPGIVSALLAQLPTGTISAGQVEDAVTAALAKIRLVTT